jgi:cleavage and polyadenylation specificity factor subunit 1
MQCYTELTPPTAVTHSLSLPFVSASANNLIVAKTSLLQIFSTKTISIEVEGSAAKELARREDAYDPTINDEDGLASSFLGEDSVIRVDRAKRTKLILVAEYTLSGTITSLVRIKTVSSKSGGEALLVGFRDAKLSLVEWDPQRPGISTISIHYYEQDELQGNPWAPSLKDCVNYLTADPGSRCAALKFGARNLAILPFKQDDEDVNMDDWDEELDGPRPADKALKTTNGDSGKEDTPYGSSFVLRLPSLDPNLTHPIHLAFLYEYREPTFGIISSMMSPASSLLHERKDNLTYMVFTLDLHQRASTTILSVGGLPYDLFEVVPLPAPVGGALLVGYNELIHIDQAGKANGVGVNMFAKQCTSFALVDQSDLQMRLEGCKVGQLSIQSGEMIIILSTGELAILSFHVDGRSVSGLSLRRVSSEAGGSLIPASVSSISSLGQNSLFVGSERADSVVLGWTRKSNQLSRRKSRLDLADEDDILLDEDEDEEEDDADDDLYGDGPSITPAGSNGAPQSDSSNTKAGDYIFSMHDSLINIAPIIDVTFGSSNVYANSEEKSNFEGVASDLELVAAVGKDKAGSMAIIQRNVQPKVIGRFEFPEARGIWTMSAKRPTEKGLEANKEKSTMSGDYGADAQYDRLMIVSKALPDGTEISDVYALTSANFEALTGTEFEPAAGSTIEAGTLGNGMRVIQVLKSEVRSYDGGKSSYFSYFPIVSRPGSGIRGEFAIFLGLIKKILLSGELSGNIQCPIASMKAFTTTTLVHSHHVPLSRYIVLQTHLHSEQNSNPMRFLDLGLAQILPMYDDDTGAEPKIVSASFADPYLLLFRDDSSIFVAQCDDNNELEEIEREDDALLATKWLTGCLYDDTTGAFAPVQSDKGYKARESVMMFLLSAGGALHVSSMSIPADAIY